MANADETRMKEPVKLAVRIVVGLTLGVLVVLAMMDYRAKSNAGRTTSAWLDALKSATAGRSELFYSDLSSDVDGSPQITGEASQGRVVYTWNGVFRLYSTTIICEGENSPVVLRIRGPGS